MTRATLKPGRATGFSSNSRRNGACLSGMRIAKGDGMSIEAGVMDRLLRVGHRADILFGRWLKLHGLDTREARVLRHVALEHDKGRLISPAEVASGLAMARSVGTRVVRRLIGQALAYRTSPWNSRNERRIILTKRGMALAREMDAVLGALGRQLVRDLREDERATLRLLLARVDERARFTPSRVRFVVPENTCRCTRARASYRPSPPRGPPGS